MEHSLISDVGNGFQLWRAPANMYTSSCGQLGVWARS